MPFTRTNWMNYSPPAINAANLLNMEDGIYYGLAHSGGVRNTAEFLDRNPASTTGGIQEAIDDLPVTGGGVFVPDDVVLTTELDINKPVYLFTGKYRRVKIDTSAGNYIKINSAHITLDGLWIYSSGVGDRFATNVFTFSKIKILNCLFDGVHINVQDTTGFAAGIWIEGNEVKNVSTATGITLGNVTDVVCAHNFIHDISSAASGEGIKVTGSCPRTTISDNVIHTCERNGIDAYNGGVDIAITGNIIYNCTSSGVELKQPTDGANRMLFCNNVLYDNGAYGLTATGNYLIIANNIVEGNASHGIDAGGTCTIIDGNMIEGNGGRGISAGSATGLAIRNNTIKGNTNECLVVSGSCDLTDITDNYLDGGVGTCLLHVGTNTTLVGNRFVTAGTPVSNTGTFSEVGHNVNYRSPAVRVYFNAAAQEIASGNWTVVDFDNERFDYYSMWAAGANSTKIYARVPGVYQITANIRWEAVAGGRRVAHLLLNGATTIAELEFEAAAAAASTPKQIITTLYELATGDFIELVVYQNSGAAVDILVDNNFSPEFMMARMA